MGRLGLLELLGPQGRPPRPPRHRTPRSVQFRAEIGRTPPRDRSGSAPRSLIAQQRSSASDAHGGNHDILSNCG